MRALHFSVAYRTKGAKQAPAQAHVRYITRAQAGRCRACRLRDTHDATDAGGFGGHRVRQSASPGRTMIRQRSLPSRIAGNGSMDAPQHRSRRCSHGRLAREELVTSSGGLCAAANWARRMPMSGAFMRRRPAMGDAIPMCILPSASGGIRTWRRRHRTYFAQQVNPEGAELQPSAVALRRTASLERYAQRGTGSGGATDRVSARSFKDQGIDWQTAIYRPRQTLQRDKALLHQRGQQLDGYPGRPGQAYPGMGGTEAGVRPHPRHGP